MNSLITIVEDDPRVDRFVVHESVHREVKMRAFFAHCLTNVAKIKTLAGVLIWSPISTLGPRKTLRNTQKQTLLRYEPP